MSSLLNIGVSSSATPRALSRLGVLRSPLQAEAAMFLHPESLLDLARLEQAERDRHLNQHLHLYALRPLRARSPGVTHRALSFRLRLARLLRAAADRLQPAPETPTPSADPRAADPLAALDTWATPRSTHAQRLREHARPHAMAIARRHDVRHLDAA